MMTIMSARMRDFCILCGSIVALTLLLAVLVPPSVSGASGVAGLPQSTHAQVVVTIRPLQLLVARLLDDNERVLCLLPAGMSPHSYAPRPSDVQAVQNARILLSLGPTLDAWSERIPAQRRYHCIDAVPSEFILQMQRHGHDHGHDHGHAHDAHDVADPHFWMDPVVCAAAVPALAAELAMVFPDEKTMIMKRVPVLQNEINMQHKKIEKMAASLRGQEIMQFHPSMNYLFRRYGITSAGVLDEIAGADPGARHVQTLIDRYDNGRLYAIIAEPQLPQRAAQHIAQRLSVPLCVVDPMGGKAQTLYAMWQMAVQSLVQVQQ